MGRSRSACAAVRMAAALVMCTAPRLAAAADIAVAPGGDLQAALNAAQGGDTVVLPAGATYVGNFRLPVHAGTSYVTIRTAGDGTAMPPSGSRVSPAYAPYMAKVTSPNNAPALRTDPGAAYWRLLFVEIAPSTNPIGTMVDLGDGSASQNDLSQVPHHLILDRVYVHGNLRDGQKRGIGLNSGATSIINSYVSEMKAVGVDAQAVAGWNGPGPYRIENNYLESAGTAVLFGGDDPKVPGLVPADVTFRGNTVSRPVRWRNPILTSPTGATATFAAGGSLPAGTYAYRVVARRMIGSTVIKSAASAEVTVAVADGSRATIQWPAVADATEYLVYGRTAASENRYWRVVTPSFTDDGVSAGTAGTPSSTATLWQVKNLFELKNARRVQADYNVIENNWAQAQSGTAILFTPRNQSGGCNWCVVEDVTFEYNVVRSIAGGIQILGWDNLHPSQQANNIRIRHNVVSDLDKSWGSNAYFLYITGGPRDLTVDHNTIISPNGSGVLIVDGAPVSNFVFTNNVARHNTYGIFGSGYAIGNGTITYYFPGSVITRNVLAGGKASVYPAGNEFPTTTDFEGHFTGYAAGDYTLVPGTTWEGSGTDGLDLGADIAKIAAARALTQEDPPQVSTTALPDATDGTVYSAAVTAGGGIPPYQWSVVAGALPPGLALDPSTGTINGTPFVAGTYPLIARVADAGGATASQPLSLRVVPRVEIMTATLDGGTASLPFVQALEASGGLGTYIWSVAAGSLPDGITLSGDGRLAGTPSARGTYTFTVAAADISEPTRAGVRSFTLEVAAKPEIVIYASDATALAGDYEFVADTTAAAGVAIWNPDRGAAKTPTAAAAPASYAEFSFYAEAGRPYHLWIRGRGERDSWANDSAFVQLSGVAGARIGTTESLTYSLETALNAGIRGWGWEDNGWGTGVLGANVVFEQSGVQTLRIQPREDGLTIDQIVLSPAQFLATSPGVLKSDTTILAK